MKQIKITPKVYIAFEFKDTDQIFIKDLNKETMQEQCKYYLRHRTGSLFIEYLGQEFYIDKEDIFYLLTHTLMMMYPELCQNKSILHSLQEKEGYAIGMDPTINKDQICLKEIYFLERDYPKDTIVQSILLPFEQFLYELYELSYEFALQHFKLKEEDIKYQTFLLRSYKEAKDALEVYKANKKDFFE
jgi:hypothetical protein